MLIETYFNFILLVYAKTDDTAYLKSENQDLKTTKINSIMATWIMLTLQPVCSVHTCTLVHSNCCPVDSSMDGGFQFSGIRHHVAVPVVPTSLKKSDTFIFKGTGSMKNASFHELICMWGKGSIFLDCWVLKKDFFVCVLNRSLQAFPCSLIWSHCVCKYCSGSN